jgi:hypothetical protein
MDPRAALTCPPSAHPAPRTRPARAERRTPFRVPCRVRLVDAVTGEVRSVLGETINLSRSGMSLQLAADVSPGTWVETLVPHPTGEPLFLCGTVVHSRRTMAAHFEIGVETSLPRTYV